MTKREAAEYLGVSIRSLERYTKSGQLACRYVPGKIGPRPVYDEPDLAAFKTRLDARKKRESVRVESSDAMRTIGFRLDPEYIDRLTDQAAKHSMSPRAYARQLLVGALEDFRHNEILAELETLREDLRRAGDGPKAAPDNQRLLATLTSLQEELRGLRVDRPSEPDHKPLLSKLAALHEELRSVRADRPAAPDYKRELGQVLAMVAQLQGDVDRLRIDLVRSLEAILLNVLPRSQQAEVRNWIATMLAGIRKPER